MADDTPRLYLWRPLFNLIQIEQGLHDGQTGWQHEVGGSGNARPQFYSVFKNSMIAIRC